MEKEKNRNIWCMDVETLASCFTYTAINIDNQQIVKFVLHKDKFELIELIEHLESCKGQIGFNNQNFDYSIIHFILKNYTNWITTQAYNHYIINWIYEEAQRIIEAQNQENFHSIVAIKQSDVIIPQLDLFRIWHYNNKARATSLKALEISMNYPNVMEMPISHTRDDIRLDEINDILEYNLNDVLATYEFYKKSLDKISLRTSLQKQFNIPCVNWSDSKIGEQLILKLYCDKTNINIWDVKKMRSHRKNINLNHCILPYINYSSKEFNDLLNRFKSKVIFETKGSVDESVIYKGFKYVYGTGGIHGCIKAGVYEADNDYLIIDADVGSLYPNLAITNNFYPEHLGETFIEVYKSIIDLRMKAKKEGNNVLSDGFKLATNSVYGKSNDINSFLFDPKFTMQITLNGQLLLTLLCEELVNKIPDLTMLQVNTDGVTVEIPKKYKNIYDDICKDWEIKTKLNLEFAEYSKMIIADVNNYIAVKVDGKCKYKGRFEIDKVVGSEPAYHKDNSFRIVSLALSEYFVKGIPIEQTIRNHKNIYDFCGRQKFKGEDYGEIHYSYYDEFGQPTLAKEKLQKNVRYYISNKGVNMIKKYAKGSNEFIHKGFNVTIFNRYELRDNYDVSYQWYINETQKEIDNIITNQLELF